MENKLNKIKKAIYDLAVKNNAAFALLFGSYARGTNTAHSDLDVIFVEETDKPFLKRMDSYFSPLSDLMNSSIDVFVYTPDEFIKMRKKFFVQRALKEGVVIFESGKLQR
ncbi:MAG: nucleotidyltransferase domain-containing protein [Actinobacteria bacterium]|nr:nucleotidyltransferase domain-containing protein [Actinomycetota bacterium]